MNHRFTASLAGIFLLSLLAWIPGCSAKREESQKSPQLSSSSNSKSISNSYQEKILRDEYFKLFMNGRPSGYQRQTLKNTELGLFSTETQQKSTMKRQNQILTTESNVSITEDSQGNIKAFKYELILSKEVKRMEATIIDNSKIVGKVTIGTQERPLSLPFDPKAKGPYYMERRCREKLANQGDTLTLPTLLPDLLKVSDITFTRGEHKVQMIDGEERIIFERKIKVKAMPAGEFSEWFIVDGGVFKATQSVPGIIIELEKTTADIVNTWKSKDPPEIFVSSAIQPNKPLPDPKLNSSADFKISFIKGTYDSLGLMEAFITAGQAIIRKDDPKSRTIRISQVRPLIQMKYPLEALGELNKFTQATPMIQSDTPEIIAKAKDLAKGETDAYDLAQKLTSFVHRHISDKNMLTGFASAQETFNTKSGDCTEHSVLLAALSRAAGIPAKVVTGLVYQKGRFVGHMWTEIFIDRWIPFDATRPQQGVGITHIGLKSTALTSAQGSDIFLELASLLGNLKIEILKP